MRRIRPRTPSVPSLANRTVLSQPLATRQSAHRLNTKPNRVHPGILRHWACFTTSASLRIHPQAFPKPSLRPLRGSFDPVLVLLALTLTSVSSYIISEYIYPPHTADPAASEVKSCPEPTPSNIPEMTSELEGRPGNLTPEHELRLKELWIALFEVLGVIESDKYTNNLSRTSSTASSPNLGGESPNLSKKKGRLSWLSRSGKNSPDIGSDQEIADDKHGLSKDFKRALASQSKESIRRAFWDMTKHDNPDALLLRFLRARKWEVHDALVMMISAFHWRSVDMKVDDELVSQGEAHFLKLGESGEGGAKKDAADMMKQFHMGKSMVHGIDKENRPITIVRARLHHPNAESEKSIEMYTVFVIESARLMLRPPVDTGTIIFDMTGFGLSNMDYAPVKFMIKCFEANYPESLGSVLVYKAPWVFTGIWKIIRGWLDPVVASKVHFCSDEAELSQYVERSQILKELGGDEDWTYKYVPPVPGENDRMADTATRDKILEERHKLSDEYERLTLAWARENDRNAAEPRSKIADQLRDNYWRLDPYVRARSLWDRTGVMGEGGKLNFYPSATQPAATQPRANDTLHAPHAADGAADLSAQTKRLSLNNHKDVDGASIYSDARSHLDADLD